MTALADRGSGLAWLDGLTGYERTGRLTRPSTAATRALVRELGDPQRNYRVLHVTGTNGKGSTAFAASALLRHAGLRVGTYSSPHLVSVGERVLVDGRPSDRLDEALRHVAVAARRCGVRPSWFEALTAAALWCFAAERVEVAVVEVGMLGRWDATNVVDGAVAVVTNVDLDHTDVAGPTRAHIAAEKAGIVRPGARLVLGERDPALRAIFEARRPGTTLVAGQDLVVRHRTTTDSTVDLCTPRSHHTGLEIAAAGRHGCENALLALGATEALLAAPLPRAVVRSALAEPGPPGRAEFLGGDPVLVLDVAHNPAGAAALRVALAEHGPPGPRTVVCALLGERSPADFLAALGVGEGDTVVAATLFGTRALPPEAVADAARELGARALFGGPPLDALALAERETGPGGMVLCTGSFQLVGPVREAGTGPGARR
ncbi:bifunctional folylpolyglutamate synthase/dihydrofolate synthase [Amycolatopsis nalaikhensis]|uniref:tetrahydrofolate synthase n=1 Tax=Amycolatopsis nalaikhensis TaxID=715472 RepID=A0ABY8XKR8_9PSEU|nr:Mur ligase family protein [Amycolatopsis sp. 2-2]WIV56240.1 Mur ligase family protein [Amycolatopsis sp. 2-2]